MSVSYLSHHHFNLQRTRENALTMCCDLQGVSLVLFWGKNCDFCQDYKPIWKHLPKAIPSVKFGMCNVGIPAIASDGRIIDKPVPRMSLGTNTPIHWVPKVICYINGKPYQHYDGDRTLQGIQKFIFQVLDDCKKYNKSGGGGMGGPRIADIDREKIETYGATPKNRARRCYLTVDAAYSSDGNKQTGAPLKRGGGTPFGQAYGVADKSLVGSGM